MKKKKVGLPLCTKVSSDGRGIASHFVGSFAYNLLAGLVINDKHLLFLPIQCRLQRPLLTGDFLNCDWSLALTDKRQTHKVQPRDNHKEAVHCRHDSVTEYNAVNDEAWRAIDNKRATNCRGRDRELAREQSTHHKKLICSLGAHTIVGRYSIKTSPLSFSFYLRILFLNSLSLNSYKNSARTACCNRNNKHA